MMIKYYAGFNPEKQQHFQIHFLFDVLCDPHGMRQKNPMIYASELLCPAHETRHLPSLAGFIKLPVLTMFPFYRWRQGFLPLDKEVVTLVKYSNQFP